MAKSKDKDTKNIEDPIVITIDDESSTNKDTKHWFVRFISPVIAFSHMSLGSNTFVAMLDTGAGVNVIGYQVLQDILPDYFSFLKPSDVNATDVNNQTLPFSGKHQLDVYFEDHLSSVTFYVLPTSTMIIISYKFLLDNCIIIVPGQGFGSKLPKAPAERVYNQARCLEL